MKLLFSCDYCGHTWQDNFYNSMSAKNQLCPRCKSKKPKYKNLDEGKIDTYAGSPPFPEEEKEDDHTTYPYDVSSID